MSDAMTLADFDAAAFLSEYWQKKPLLIRNPWRGWANPVEPDELAGLACEEGVESRLIVRKGDGWAVEHGPLKTARFGKLGKAPWTLLVQAVDAHAPDVAALIEPFRFIPDWRIDDVMVSYATDGGGVGPHYDQYDVFLIQGLGRRRWRIGRHCDADTPLRAHDDLRLLDAFEAVDEWVLEPGDMLYVPPGVAHDGIAVGDDCMTYSVGFRAPSRAELVEGWCADVAERLSEDDRYADPDLTAQAHPGEIGAAALAQLQAMVMEAMAEPVAFARWFGEWSTTRKYAELDYSPDEAVEDDAVRALLAEGAALLRNPASRFAFVREEAGGLRLFADGVVFDCVGDAAAFAERLCAGDIETTAAWAAPSDALVGLVAALVNRGSVGFEDEAQ